MKPGILLLPFLLLLISPASECTGQEHKNDLPPLNQAILRYVDSVIGKQVDRGECWDLAYQALERNQADWDGQYRYGKRLDPKKEKVLPGDLIQFEKVKVQYSKGNTYYTESYGHHTAIVYKVLGPGKYELAHQNTGFSGRKVGISSFDMDHVRKGKIFIYRPVPK